MAILPSLGPAGSLALKALTVLAYAAAFLVVYAALSFLLHIHPLRVRSHTTPGDLGLAYEDVRFLTADGVRLAGWWIPASNATGTIIIGHGYPFDKGNVLPAYRFLHPRFNLLFYDHRSFGKSGGHFTTAGAREARDVEAAKTYVQTRLGGVHPIGFLGFSLSAAAMLQSDLTGVRALVADSSYANLADLMQSSFPFLPGPLARFVVGIERGLARLFFGFDPARVRPDLAAARLAVPTLLIHGAKDTQIPTAHSRAIFSHAPKDLVTLWIVEGADHGAAHHARPEEYEERVMAFFSEHLSGPSPEKNQKPFKPRLKPPRP